MSVFRPASQCSRITTGRSATAASVAERLYRVARWTPMPAGGHFPATEQPELLARDIAAFFAQL